MNTNPITLTMAAVLHSTIEHHGRASASTDERTLGVLVRRGLLERVECQNEDGRQYRITQTGREALALYRWCQNDPAHTVQQPNVIVRCLWWTDFYGLHCEIRYLDDPNQLVRIEWARSFDSDYKALRYVLQDLTGARHLLLACCPENHNPDMEE